MGLEISGVSVRFGGLHALDDVSIDARGGMITGLIGPNGAGKTTLFNVITGVQRAASGRVLLDDTRIDRVPAHRRARLGLGRTFQRLELFGSLSVRENIRVATGALPRSRREATVNQLLDRVGLGDVADERADALSTGVGRMLELARCLAAEPSVLLLDEPASGQDDQDTARFAALLTSLAADGMAVLLVEHDMELVMGVCERVHVLEFGRLIASGTAEEIKNDERVRVAYLGEEVPA
ncbi:MAG: ABC transporter ATP-binding protein [Acidimicrobiales bacterium]|nr:ABC transporter ATP-binding protein [Acidimicrobiales bacterium]